MGLRVSFPASENSAERTGGPSTHAAGQACTQAAATHDSQRRLQAVDLGDVMPPVACHRRCCCTARGKGARRMGRRGKEAREQGGRVGGVITRQMWQGARCDRATCDCDPARTRSRAHRHAQARTQAQAHAPTVNAARRSSELMSR